MTPEQRQQFANFRILGQDEPTQGETAETGLNNILGQAFENFTPQPDSLMTAGLLGAGTQGMLNFGGSGQSPVTSGPGALIGQPRTTSTTPRLVGPASAPQYTGPSPARPVPGTQMVPSGQSPSVRPASGAPVAQPVQPSAQQQPLARSGAGTMSQANQVGRFQGRPMRGVSGTATTVAPNQSGGGVPRLLGQASRLSRAAGPLFAYSLADMATEQLTGQGISDRIGSGLGEMLGGALFGDGSQPAFTPEELEAARQSTPTYEESQGLEPINLGTIVRQSDPIRGSFTLPSGEVVMERESGERFNPTAEQIESFNQSMSEASQPSVTGLGEGGSEGVRVTNQTPPSVVETQAMLQERFGAPTISAIQQLPQGQGMGMQTDAQGRMLTPGVDRGDFEQASQARSDSIQFRRDQPGGLDLSEPVSDRERRGGEMSMEAATRITGGDPDAARALIEQQRQGIGQFQETGEFEPREFEVGGRKYIQLSPEYVQPVPDEPAEEPAFEPRTREVNGVTYVEESPNRFRPLPTSQRGSGDAGDLSSIFGGQGEDSNTETIRMRRPDGELRDVPLKDVEKALEAEYTRV